jgi:hypothetical protein
MRRTIPNPVIAVVADVIGTHYYNHSKLNTLFMEAGAPGEPPEGNCVQKCLSWLKRVNDTPEVDPLKVLGGVLFQFMETGGGGSNYYYGGTLKATQERVRSVLSRCALTYQEYGIVLAGGDAPPVASLNEALRRRDLPTLEIEFKRALDTLEQDPPAALTAASSILESLFKVILEEEGTPLPQKETIKPLWAAVQDRLGLSPATVSEEDVRRVLSGLTSIVDGIGALRTHAGSAHGHGKEMYKVLPHQARLVVHAAHTLCLFVLETWEFHAK